MSRGGLAVDFAGAIVVLLGRPGSIARPALVQALQERGAVVRRGLAHRSALVAVLQGAHRLLGTGRLEKKIAQADRLGIPCVSEGMLLRALGLLQNDVAAPAISADQLPATTGLSAEQLRLLELFDVFALRDGGCSFFDLHAARQVARLLGEGADLAAIVRSACRLRRVVPTGSGAGGVGRRGAADLVRLGGGFALRSGGHLQDFDGQFLMPLADTAPSADVLFEAAEAAEAAGDWASAEVHYRRCLMADPTDPIFPFNLSNLLRESGRRAEAAVYLRRALALDGAFAEAWYNLAKLMEQAGRRGDAKDCLGRALAADPCYADALFNLALLHYQDGAYLVAAQRWREYLALDADSEWSRKARAGLLLCEQTPGAAEPQKRRMEDGNAAGPDRATIRP